MTVYPNDTRSTRKVIPMTETERLEPSFADAIAAIEKSSELTASRRTHWACSLRKIAEALGRPPENIAARWGAVALRLNQLHHAQAGTAWKTLANHKSNAKAALFWFQKDEGLPSRGMALGPEWKKLRRRLKDRSRLAKLSGLIRYCSLKGITPDEVDDAMIDGYMAYRRETTALAADNKAQRAIARAWNASRSIEGWPQQELIEPPLKAKEGPRWKDFPEELRGDVDAHLKFLATARRARNGKRLRPCKASTLRTRRSDLISFAKKAMRLGTPMDELTSLGSLLNPTLVEQILNDEWEKNGDEPKTSTIDLAKKLVAVARSANCLDEEAIAKLDDMRANLEQYRSGGMTEKNLKLIRQVLNSDVWSGVVNSPLELMGKARSLRDQAAAKAAITAQMAIAIALLTVAPVRAANLTSIRLDENLIRPGGPGTNFVLTFPHYDVKNRVDLTFELDEYVTELIDEYVQNFRPALMRGSNEDWLFPGSKRGPKDSHLFGIQITDRIERITGVRMTIHQFRHAAAAIYLKHRPGDYETVRRFLGHRNIRTTVNFYCGLETIQATRLLGDIVRRHRKSDSNTGHPGT
jgi:integrase